MKTFSLLFIPFLLLQFDNIAQEHWSWQDPSNIDSLIEAKMETYHIPGIQALIYANDELVWDRNFGFAHLNPNQSVEDSTLFLMTSISKTVLATAIMQLWEDNLFDLDDNINDYLHPDLQVINPTFPNDTITFKMLLTHTSSVNDNWTVLSPLVICGDSPISLDSLIVNYFTPGGVYYSTDNFINYSPSSNTFQFSHIGPSLLAHLVEKISGAPFEEYCKNNIFDPLGMNSVSWHLDGLDTSRIATPYEWTGSQYYSVCHQGLPFYPALFLRTNKIELLKFMNSFLNWGSYNGATILDSTTVDLMLTEYYPSNYYFYDQAGLLWMRSTFSSTALWGAFGWGPGFSSAMYLSKEEKYGFMIFFNRSTFPDIYQFWEIVELIADYAYSIVSDVEDYQSAPINYLLEQNYPNPFNPVTTIKFSVPSTSLVKIKVYNLLGEEVTRLVNEEKLAGNYQIEFNASGLSSGVYFYSLQAGDFVETKKMILLR